MDTILGTAAGFAFQEWLRSQVRRDEEAPRFPETEDEVRAYQETVRRFIGQAAGPVPEYDPLEAEVHQVQQRDGYRIEAISFPTFAGLRMTANAYVPDVAEPVPGILVVHGHSQHGRRDPRTQRLASLLVRSGYFVLTVDAIGNGERAVELPGSYHGGNLAGALWTVGYSLFGIQIHENYRAVDYLCSRPEVDKTRIGMTGGSGGGNQSMYSGAWDERIKAIVPVASAGSYRKLVGSFNCMCETPHRLAGLCEQYDIFASMAPRALLVISAKVDNVTFRFEDAGATVDKASRVWSLLGAPESVAFAAVDDTHGYHDSARRLSLAWFNRWLKGSDKREPADLPEVTIEDYAAISCYPTAAESRVLTLPKLFAQLRARVEANSRSLGPAERLQRLRTLFAAPKPIRLQAEPVNLLSGMTPGSTGVSWLFRTDDGVLIPARVYWPDFSQMAEHSLLLVRDKHPDPVTAQLTRHALSKGMAVWAVDLPGLGEARLPGEMRENVGEALKIRGAISAVRACHMLGFHLVGYWIAFMRELGQHIAQEMNTVSLAAAGGPATAVLAASALLDGFDRLFVFHPVASYKLSDTFRDVTFEAIIADLLSIGDVPELAALAAPRPLTVVAPLSQHGEPLAVDEALEVFAPTAAAYRDAGRSQAFHLVGPAEAGSSHLLELSS